MSERGSFTTNYMSEDDCKVIREALDQKDKYLCISPPAAWSNGETTFEMPIVSGKAGSSVSNLEWLTIVDELCGIKTKETVRVVVMCDAGDIELITKHPDGKVESELLAGETE